jgi:hypothetical protein
MIRLLPRLDAEGCWHWAVRAWSAPTATACRELPVTYDRQAALAVLISAWYPAASMCAAHDLHVSTLMLHATPLGDEGEWPHESGRFGPALPHVPATWPDIRPWPLPPGHTTPTIPTTAVETP